MKNPGVWAAAAASLVIHGGLLILPGIVTGSDPRSAGASGRNLLTVTLEERELPSLPGVLPAASSPPLPEDRREAGTSGAPPELSSEPGNGESPVPSGPGVDTPPAENAPELREPFPPLNTEIYFRLPPDFRPEYPLLARRKKWEGTARFEVVLDRSGEILSLKLLESSGYGLLDESGRRALEKAEFLPGMEERGTVELVFRLE